MTAGISRYSVEEFVNTTSQKDKNEGFFEQETPRIMEINLSNNLAWIKKGAMIAYTGDVKFIMEDLFEHGLKTVVKRFVTGESGNLVKAQGTGKVYIADEGKKISILNMQNDSIIVNGSNLLAFEPSLKWDIKLMKLASMMAGGLTNIEVNGTGMLAITTMYEPMSLRVTPNCPVMTDPTATVAWEKASGACHRLAPRFRGHGHGQRRRAVLGGSGG